MVFREGRGHIVFGVDPVHISISVRIAYGWNMTKLIQIHHWVGERVDYIFVALISLSRSH